MTEETSIKFFGSACVKGVNEHIFPEESWERFRSHYTFLPFFLCPIICVYFFLTALILEIEIIKRYFHCKIKLSMNHKSKSVAHSVFKKNQERGFLSCL